MTSFIDVFSIVFTIVFVYGLIVSRRLDMSQRESLKNHSNPFQQIEEKIIGAHRVSPHVLRAPSTEHAVIVNPGEMIMNESNYSDYEREVRRLDETTDDHDLLDARMEELSRRAKEELLQTQALRRKAEKLGIDIDQQVGRIVGGPTLHIGHTRKPRPTRIQRRLVDRFNKFLRPG